MTCSVTSLLPLALISCCIYLIHATSTDDGRQFQTTTAYTTTTTTTPPTPMPVFVASYVEPNGTLDVVASSNPANRSRLYGSTVCWRPSPGVQSDAYVIQIDSRHALPSGLLEYFYIYAQTTGDHAASTGYLRLQIWRPTGLSDEFQLVWQRRVSLNDSLNGALYAFNVSEDKFQVKAGDLLGWTGEDNNRIVSRDDDVSVPRCTDCSRSAFIFDKHKPWLPRVRDEPYRDIRLSARQFVFSAAVRIQTPSAPSTTVSTTVQPRPPSHSSVKVIASNSSTKPINVTSSLSATTSDTAAGRIRTSSDHTIATTIGIVFGVIGAVIVAILVVAVWKRHEVWAMLKSSVKSSQDSRVELLNSGSSTPNSLEHADDSDTNSVTTTSGSSSSGSVTAPGRGTSGPSKRDPPTAHVRPRAFQFPFPFTGRSTDDHVTTRAPIPAGASRYQYDNGGRYNRGFSMDDVMIKPEERTRPDAYFHRPQPAAVVHARGAAAAVESPSSRKSDGRVHVHCVSVELHHAPSHADNRLDDNPSIMI